MCFTMRFGLMRYELITSLKGGSADRAIHPIETTFPHSIATFCKVARFGTLQPPVLVSEESSLQESRVHQTKFLAQRLREEKRLQRVVVSSPMLKESFGTRNTPKDFDGAHKSLSERRMVLIRKPAARSKSRKRGLPVVACDFHPAKKGCHHLLVVLWKLDHALEPPETPLRERKVKG